MSLLEQKNRIDAAAEIEEIPLADSQNVPVIYADGVADVEIHGAICRIIFFEFRIIGGVRMRCPVLEMIRTVASCEWPVVAEAIARKRAAERAH